MKYELLIDVKNYVVKQNALIDELNKFKSETTNLTNSQEHKKVIYALLSKFVNKFIEQENFINDLTIKNILARLAGFNQYF